MNMPKRLLLLAIFPMLISTQALAQTGCHNDKMSNTNGRTIRLGSGWILMAYPGSGSTLSFWQPLDKVVVCPLGGAAYSITNTSKKNQVVKALRQYS